MALPAFDTHDYIKQLLSAGFNEQQAETQAKLQCEVLSLATTQLATKEDILRLELATKEDIVLLRSETKEKIGRLEQEVIRLDAKVDKLDIKFTGKFNLLNWMMGFLITIVVAMFLKLFLPS